MQRDETRGDRKESEGKTDAMQEFNLKKCGDKRVATHKVRQEMRNDV